ncbi:MAG: glycine cleavage system aminomethyltransferase GcvT [Candidatus Atelocyanobacterium thalassa]
MINSSISQNLLKTPIYDFIIEEKAKMINFFGWHMPIQFDGIQVEHNAVRNNVGIFDISHMGKLLIEGDELVSLLQFLVPSDIKRLTSGKAQYTTFLNHNGGIIDDIIIYYQNSKKVIIITNSSTKDKDIEWIKSHTMSTPIKVTDLSEEKVLLAIQGPQALEKLQLFTDSDIAKLSFFGHIETKILGYPAFVSRTGYTGEDGFEIMVSNEVGRKLWKVFTNKKVIPCGLGARDTLRLEASMCLYGQDIDDSTTPLEAGLNNFVHLDSKDNFIGREVLEQQTREGVSKLLVVLEMEGKQIARRGYNIFSNGKCISTITSGTFIPTTKKALSFAYLPIHLSQAGTVIDVEIRKKLYPAKVIKKTFYKSRKKKNKT